MADGGGAHQPGRRLSGPWRLREGDCRLRGGRPTRSAVPCDRRLFHAGSRLCQNAPMGQGDCRLLRGDQPRPEGLPTRQHGLCDSWNGLRGKRGTRQGDPRFHPGDLPRHVPARVGLGCGISKRSGKAKRNEEAFATVSLL